MIDALEATATPYMLVGSWSSNHYGVPRSTDDADFVIQLGEGSISRIMEHLRPEIGLDP